MNRHRCKKCKRPTKTLSDRHGAKAIYKATDVKICHQCRSIYVPEGSGFKLKVYSLNGGN